MSINDKLNQHIETNCNKPAAQAEAFRSYFSQEKHKEFLQKIRDHKDFYASNSNDLHRVVVDRGKVLIDERSTIEDEIPVGRVFPFNHVWKPRVQNFWPKKSNIIVFLNEEDHIEVIVNDVITNFDKALKFLDFALFE